MCAHWKLGGCGALGEPTRNPSSGVCKSGDILAAEGDEKELSTNLSALVYSLLQESALAPGEVPNLSVKGTSPADMDAGRCRLLASLPFPM